MSVIAIDETGGTPFLEVFLPPKTYDLDRIRDVIRSTLSTISTLPVIWIDQKRPFVAPGPRGIILLTTIAGTIQGHDERFQEEDFSQGSGSELGDRWDGVRTFTLSIRCESYEQANSKVAANYLEILRSRLNFMSVKAAFNRANLAWYETKDVVDLSEVRDGHQTSIAVLDVLMRASVSERDPNRYGWIDSVGVAFSGI